jgi:hypothetical protein
LQTFVSDILIAVNPFKTLPIYTEDVARNFSNCNPAFVKPHVSKQPPRPSFSTPPKPALGRVPRPLIIFFR